MHKPLGLQSCVGFWSLVQNRKWGAQCWHRTGIKRVSKTDSLHREGPLCGPHGLWELSAATPASWPYFLSSPCLSPLYFPSAENLHISDSSLPVPFFFSRLNSRVNILFWPTPQNSYNLCVSSSSNIWHKLLNNILKYI